MGVKNPNEVAEIRIKAPEGFLDAVDGWPDGEVDSNDNVDDALIEVQAWQFPDCAPAIMLALHIHDVIEVPDNVDWLWLEKASTRAGVILDLETAKLLRDTLSDYIERASRPMLKLVK